MMTHWIDIKSLELDKIQFDHQDIHQKIGKRLHWQRQHPLKKFHWFFYFSSLQWPQRKDSSGGWIECEEIKLIVQRGNFVGEVGFGIKKARAIQPVIAVGRVLTI